MKTMIVLVISMLTSPYLCSQVSFQELKNAPEKVSNNAVASVEVDGDWYVYSFAGIDSTKLYTGIHSKVFRYDVMHDTWSQLPFDLPSGPKRIAAGASTVRGKIYVIGGYQVFSNGGEVSVNRVHIYDPALDMFLDDGASIPTPIDDQVQCVYKDSLIYVVTGWSNSGNVSDVWIYDVVQDEWKAGTAIPDDNDFQAFGASGSIVGDTIYYIGGARDIGSFGLISTLRKGYINPNNPTDITWFLQDNNQAGIYRSGSEAYDGKVIWLGGSENTYNYNGIAYDGSGGVPPTNALLYYEPAEGSLVKQYFDFPMIMDLRGLAKVGDNQFITVGGMKDVQEVSDRVVLYELGTLVNQEAVPTLAEFRVFPTSTTGLVQVYFKLDTQVKNIELKIFRIDGTLLRTEKLSSVESMIHLDSQYPAGSYVFSLVKEGITLASQRIIKL